LLLLIRAAGDCMVRVHCSKDTLDASPRVRERLSNPADLVARHAFAKGPKGWVTGAVCQLQYKYITVPTFDNARKVLAQLHGDDRLKKAWAFSFRDNYSAHKNWKAEAELTKGNVIPSNGCENGTQFTQECDTVYNGINKSDMNKEHSLEMIKQVDAFLATNPDPGIVALGKEGNAQQAIKLLPTAKFEVKKPSRAVHICWMENAREIWYTQARRSLIWKHFVFNGKVKLPGVGYVKFKEREQYRERIFGKKAKKGGKRKRKEASDKVDQDLIDFLIGSYMTSGESKHELADREEAITGINPLSHPDRQLETAADLLPDGHEDVQCDSDCD
jgi:hypothetical protein